MFGVDRFKLFGGVARVAGVQQRQRLVVHEVGRIDDDLLVQLVILAAGSRAAAPAQREAPPYGGGMTNGKGDDPCGLA